MRIYRLNENLSVRLKALQLYIYWGALKGPVSYTHLDVYKRQIHSIVINHGQEVKIIIHCSTQSAP